MSNLGWNLPERPLDPPEPRISTAAFESMRREMANDIMGSTHDKNLNEAWNAVSEDDDTMLAMMEMIRSYDDSDKLTLKDAQFNHHLVCDFIQSVRAYVESRIPEHEILDNLR